jgi:hypothetical protein
LFLFLQRAGLLLRGHVLSGLQHLCPYQLEPVESIPVLRSVPLALLQNTLQNIKVSLNAILNVDYFETQDLRKYSQRSQLKGVLPIIFVFLARSGKEILKL